VPRKKQTNTPAAARNTGAPHLPSKQQILDFIESAPDRVGKREIARAFNVKGAAKIDLKRRLAQMADDGLIDSPRKRISPTDVLPPVGVIEVVGRDAHGDLVARPESWDSETGGEAPKILVVHDSRKSGAAPGIGDRLLARLDRLKPDEIEDGVSYRARPMKRLQRETTRLLGVFRSLKGGDGVIDPIDRKQLKEWPVPRGDTGDAVDGELVRFEISRARGRYGPAKAKVLERLGDPAHEGTISLIAIHEHGLRDSFPDDVLAEAEALEPADLQGRTDMRDIPLITIDPEDARDHDDAVWASPDTDPANPDGWMVVVAIADVSWFVRTGSALDKEALLRGNSAYFPDRVVPMLPERISADLCSLREGENRACLALRMVFDRNGNKKSHRFERGLMRSAASLSYSQAQAAFDGNPDAKADPLQETVLKPLWQAYQTLARARDKRQPLDLDLPERKVLLDEKGQIRDIVVPPRLEAHRLIEEFMIQANVAAAEALESKRSPLVYRVHDAPSKEKLIALAEFLESLDMALPKAGTLRPEHFNRILERARESDNAELVSEVVLRSQSQAEYSPGNFGHFGLNLRRYAHFTSPIRRYADLLVHRALVRVLDLGKGGLTDGEIDRLDEMSESISKTERIAMMAERQTVDRLIAAWLEDRVGATFPARISGVTRSGLFVKLDQTGADGFVPASTIGQDFYRHDEARQALVGDRTGEAFQLGDRVEVRLVEVIASAGAMRFEILTDGKQIGPSTSRSRKPRGAKRPPPKGAKRTPPKGGKAKRPRGKPSSQKSRKASR